MSSQGKFKFAIDRGGTFTDIFSQCPDGRVRVLKLLSVDPQNYQDAPTEGIRRILQEVSYFYTHKTHWFVEKTANLNVYFDFAGDLNSSEGRRYNALRAAVNLNLKSW